jgi:hypothetical protein
MMLSFLINAAGMGAVHMETPVNKLSKIVSSEDNVTWTVTNFLWRFVLSEKADLRNLAPVSDELRQLCCCDCSVVPYQLHRIGASANLKYRRIWPIGAN